MKHLVLLAEDTTDNLDYFIKALKDVVRLETVRNGREALECYRTRRDSGCPYALVILDVAMPYIDGFDVAEAIRAEGDAETPIVFLTAYAEPETVGRATRSGAVVWAKPILSDELVGKVKALLAGEASDG